MSQKEYLLAILDRVAAVSDVALGLQTLIQYGEVNDDILAALVTIFRGILKDAKNASDIAVLEKVTTTLERLHAQEELEHAQDLAELDDLLDSI